MVYFFPGFFVVLILSLAPIFAVLGYLLVLAIGELASSVVRKNNTTKNTHRLTSNIAILTSWVLVLVGCFFAHQAWNCFPSISGYGTIGVCWIEYPLYSKSNSTIESRTYGDALVGSSQQLSYMPVVLDDNEVEYIETLAFEHRCDLLENPYRVDGERNESTYYLECKSGEMEFVCSSLPPNAECWRTR